MIYKKERKEKKREKEKKKALKVSVILLGCGSCLCGWG